MATPCALTADGYLNPDWLIRRTKMASGVLNEGIAKLISKNTLVYILL
jgi:hypothetical protein